MKKELKKKVFSEAKIQKMMKIISDMKKKMSEIDKMKNDIDYKHISFSKTPKQTRALIEEIRVPSLEMLRDESGKKA